MDATFREALLTAPDEGFSLWATGDRASPECEQLVAIAESLPLPTLVAAHAALASAASAAEPVWRELGAAGVTVGAFLGVTSSLMASSDADVAATAAAIYLAGARCAGAVPFGVLNPMAAFELSKAVRTEAFTRLRGAEAAPPAKSAGRKRAKPAANEDCDSDEEGGFGGSARAETRALVARELVLLLEQVPLRAHSEVLAQLVAALVGAAVSSAHGGRRAARAGKACGGHFEALSLCLRPEHGEPGATAPLVMRSLLPHLSLSPSGGSGSAAAGKEAIAAQAACVDFVVSAAAAAAPAEGSPADEAARSLLLSIQALLQRVALAAPDRAEPRAAVCGSVARLLRGLPPAVTSRYSRFVWRLAHVAKVGARTVAVEIAAAILELGAEGCDAALAAEDAPQTLWRLLLLRASDKAPGVRAKAVGCLSSLIAALHTPAGARLLALVQQPPALAAASPGGATPALPSPLDAMPPPPPRRDSEGGRSSIGSAGTPAAATPGGDASPSASLVSAAKMEASLASVASLLQSRCADERPAVRRAALGAIEAYGLASSDGLSPAALAAVEERCRDASPLIRKQAAKCLAALLAARPSSPAERRAWIDGSLPLCRDSEASVTDAALDSLEELLLRPLAAAEKKPSEAASLPLWPLLEDLSAAAIPALQHALGVLAARGRTPPALARSVQALLSPSGAGCGAVRPPLWAMLLQLAQQKPKGREAVDAAAVLRCWRKAGAADPAEAAAALRVLLCLARRGALEEGELEGELKGELLSRLQQPDCDTETAALLVQICCALGGDGWAEPLRRACAETINAAAVLFPHTHSLTTSTRDVQRALVVYGELSLEEEDAAASAGSRASVSASTKAVVAAATEFAHGECDPALSATAFVTLGKLCMGSAALAKKLLPMFVRELSTSPQWAVRNNALVVLFDLVKAHTALLDRHVGSLGLAVSDASPVVRHQAILLLTQLLLEDYVKWRPSLLRAFCRSLVDAEPTLRAAGRACLFDMLLPRSPHLALASFVPLLFQLNGCTALPAHATPLPRDEKEALDLSGAEQQRPRLQILRALLSSMGDEQRLQATAKLCHEVLAPVLDGQMELSAAAVHAVVSDSLRLLACKEAKVGSGAGASADEPAEDGNAAAAAARGKVLSQVARKATVEAIVPIVVELKRHLEAAHSPLLRDVSLFVRELLRDHKPLLADILARDKQLATEIEYDMKQLDRRSSSMVTPAPRGLPPPAADQAARRDSLGGAATPRRPSSSARDSAGSVPTPDRMRGALSVPKLRSQRSSLGASGGSRATALAPSAPSLVNRQGGGGSPPPKTQSETQSETQDVQMASPFRGQPPPRVWNVCPSPQAKGLFDAVA